MSIVLTYGTFDLFHVGHVRLLKRLRQFGDELIVGCSTDEFNALKGKKTIMPFEHRREILSSCCYVSKVIEENSWEQKVADIIQHKVDIFAMGDDWAGKFDSLSDHCKVIYLPRTPDISSTEVKSMVASIHSEQILTLKNLVDQMSKVLSLEV